MARRKQERKGSPELEEEESEQNSRQKRSKLSESSETPSLHQRKKDFTDNTVHSWSKRKGSNFLSPAKSLHLIDDKQSTLPVNGEEKEQKKGSRLPESSEITSLQTVHSFSYSATKNLLMSITIPNPPPPLSLPPCLKLQRSTIQYEEVRRGALSQIEIALGGDPGFIIVLYDDARMGACLTAADAQSLHWGLLQQPLYPPI